MIKLLIVLSVVAAALSQEHQFRIDNLGDYNESPYRTIYPYPYQEDRERNTVNVQREPNNNVNKKYEVVVLPAKLKESREVRTFTSSMSLTSILLSGAKKMFGLAKTVLKELLSNAPGMIFGGFVVVLFCKVTSVCTKLSSIKSLSEIQKEFGTFLTPERMDMATEFVQEAIRRYRSIQND